MKELLVNREVGQRMRRMSLGVNPYAPRLFASQVRNAHADAAILALPIDTDDLAPMQDASGGFYFSLDESGLDGADGLQ